MTDFQSPIIIIIAPLLSALLATLFGLFNRKLSYPIALVAMAISLYCAFDTLMTVIKSGTLHYKLGGWIPPFGIEYVIDHLNAFVLVIVAFVGLINVVHSRKSVERDFPEKTPQFYTLFLLLVTGLLGITITGDVFNLYVLLEISALASYALIAMGSGRAKLSSYNYLIMGTIGASLYLLGVGHLYIVTGTLNMGNLHAVLPTLSGNSAVLVAAILMLVGVWAKMAFFPLHGWLPNAYTHSPSSVSSLLAPTMTKVSVYIMIRIMFSVFTPEFMFKHLIWQDAIIWFAVIAIVGGALQAIAQRDFKKMLTYLIVSEIGYMVGGVWLGNRYGITGATLHILNDALMMLALLFVSGNIFYMIKSHKFEDFSGLFKKMPYTMTAFIIAALSMIGVPPTAGFFSKWYLILGAIEAGKWHFMVALIFSSLVNAVLFFRIIECSHFNKNSDTHEHRPAPIIINEAPISMVVTSLFVAVCLIVVGVYSGEIVEQVIQHTSIIGAGN